MKRNDTSDTFNEMYYYSRNMGYGRVAAHRMALKTPKVRAALKSYAARKPVITFVMRTLAWIVFATPILIVGLTIGGLLF